MSSCEINASHTAPLGSFGASQNQGDAPSIVGEIALHAGKRDSVIGGADDECVFAETIAINGIEYLPHAFVHEPGAGAITGEVAPGFGRVRNRSGQRGVVGLVFRGSLRILAVCLKESDIEKKGAAGRLSK